MLVSVNVDGDDLFLDSISSFSISDSVCNLSSCSFDFSVVSPFDDAEELCSEGVAGSDYGHTDVVSHALLSFSSVSCL